MRNKFGVDSFIWSENFSREDVWIIEKAKDMGFEYIDFAIGDPDIFPVEEVKEKLKENKMNCVCTIALPMDANPISEDEKVRKHAADVMRQAVDICNAIKAPILGGVNYAAWGYLARRPRTKWEWGQAVAGIKAAAEYAKKTGDVTICVECVNRFETHLLNIAEDAVRFCKETQMDNVKVHLDCFHMIREEKSFREAVLACGKEYLGYIHVNENDRGIPGTGMVPFKEFFTAVSEVGYDGPLVIESFDPDFVETAANCAIWRKFADTGEDLAREGLLRLREIAAAID